jgi:putative ATP-binding cassette transporter
MALLYVGVFALLTCTAVFCRFVEERLALLWREWLTRQLVARYLEQQTYHRLNAIGTLGNPDQRIADDVRSFTASTLSFALIFLNGTFTIIAFSGVLWSISRTLFFTAVGYAVFGSSIAVVLGRRLMPLNYDQSDREADFRAHLIHVRENAESIALLHREPHIGARLRGQVDAFTANLKRIIAVNRNLGFFTTGYNFAQLIPALLVARSSSRTWRSIIPQASSHSRRSSAHSPDREQFPVTVCGAVLARLSAMIDAAEVEHRPPGHPGRRRRASPLEQLTLHTPREEPATRRRCR